MKTDYKILVGMPCYTGMISVETTLSLLSLLRYHTAKYPNHEIMFNVRVRNFVTYAAEKITESAVENNCTHMFYMGDDVTFNPDTLERLLNHDKDIVGLSIFARSAPYAYYALNEDGTHWGLKQLGKGLKKASSVGTGVMLFKTSVFDGLERPWWRWPNDDKTDCDTEFFQRLKKEKDIDVWVDTDVVAGHLDFSHQVIDHRTHKAYIDSIRQSGMLDREDVKSHKDFHKLEALVNGAQ